MSDEAGEVRKPRKGMRMSEWISVRERLPEPWTDVLVFPEWGSDGVVGISRFSETWGWIEGVEDGWAPTHWMPLPATPQECPNG